MDSVSFLFYLFTFFLLFFFVSLCAEINGKNASAGLKMAFSVILSVFCLAEYSIKNQKL